MSTTEFAPVSKNPLEQEPGLYPEDNQKALQLRKRLESAADHDSGLRQRRFESYHRSLGRELNEMAEEWKAGRRVDKIHKASAEHYEQHEGEYQVQAVKDATAEKAHTNFGT